MKKEKPVRVIPGSGKHKTETRIFARDIHESFCVQPKCRFRGKHAVQGVCHTTDMSIIDVDKITKEEAELTKEFDSAVKGKSGRELIAWTRSMYVSAMINWSFGLDETIMLRAENAILRDRVARYKARGRR